MRVYSCTSPRSLHIELLRNQALRADNQKGLVEVFRSISEILIWGDQNDSKIFELVSKTLISYNFNPHINMTVMLDITSLASGTLQC